MLGSIDRRLELNRFILLKSRGGETRGMLLLSIVLFMFVGVSVQSRFDCLMCQYVFAALYRIRS